MKCKRCGYCCTLVPVITWIDILRIKLSGEKDFWIRDLNNKKTLKMDKGDCHFLRRDGKKTSCRVYRYRPKVCRQYPKSGQGCDVKIY